MQTYTVVLELFENSERLWNPSRSHVVQSFSVHFAIHLDDTKKTTAESFLLRRKGWSKLRCVPSTSAKGL